MTRFARAKGSKSSNERAPEDGTPWEVMKEQLMQSKRENEEAKNREQAEQQRLENYQNFLKEHKVQKKKAEWCDFPETHKIQGNSEQPPRKKKKKNKPQKNNDEALNVSSVKSKQNNENKDDVVQSNNDLPLGNVSEVAPTKTKKKNKNKKKSNKNISDNDGQQIESEDISNSQSYNKQLKKNKNKNNNKQSSEPRQLGNEQSEQSLETEDKNSSNQPDNNKKQQKKKKSPKFVDGKPVRRKEINDRSFQLIISGKEVELVRFDGFPIMKKDAERLDELRKNMMKKGIPKSEVQRTMKLERRRAEKALARMKREVCYNCRKGGHNLSDCPDLKSKIPGVDAAEGVCFKCGSTEHKQFECKVQKDKEFKFATCFICKEPGHIARQCPDNPKGLYPNGGSCKLCGDVTHLRKDCPTVHDKREESTIKLQTLDNNVEDMGIQMKTKTMGDTAKKPKKIKF